MNSIKKPEEWQIIIFVYLGYGMMMFRIEISTYLCQHLEKFRLFGIMVVDACYVRIEMKADDHLLRILMVDRLGEARRRSRNIHDAFRILSRYQRNIS